MRKKSWSSKEVHRPKRINKERYLLLQIGLLAAAYYAAAYLGMFLEGGQRGAMPIPLPAGVALAALLLFGMRLWPGILVGLFLFSAIEEGIAFSTFSVGIPLPLVILEALGAIIQAVSGAYLLQRFHFKDTFPRVLDVFLFAVTVVLISPLLGSSTYIGGTLFLGHIHAEFAYIPFDFASQIWLTRWFSDGIGMLILAAGALVWRQRPPVPCNYLRLLEWGFILLCLTITSYLTLKVDYGNRLVLLYTILPLAVWAAVRFEQHGATLAALIIASILLSGGLDRIYPTGEFAGTRDLLLEIGFIGITAFTAFLVAAAYTERRYAEENLYREKELAITTLHSIADAVITTDIHGQITYLNPIAEELTGWSSSQAVEKPTAQIFQVKSMGPDSMLEKPVERCLHGVVSLPRRSILINRDKRAIAIENSAAPIRNRAGKIEGVIIVFHDVSKEQHLREQLSHQASHDALTGLCNRREFEYQLSMLLNSAKTEDTYHSLLYLDLDQFKIVNDTCGHAAGDALLKQLVTVVQGRVRAGDTFARLGGDEFGILLKHCPLEQANAVAESFLNTVRDFRFVWEDKTFEIGVSIGVVPINAQSENLAAVLSQADLACYAAKDSGRNCIHVHLENDENLVALRMNEMQWVSHILKAIEEDRLVLYRQEIAPVDRHAQHVKPHYEILIRMRDEQGAIVPPGSFLPAAERYNLMPKIDRWVVHKIFVHLAQHPDVDIDFIAINLSGATLNEHNFAQFVRDELSRLAVPTRAICFEITETAAISSLDKAAKFMREMSELGFRFALDDFGSGVSSFGYLKQLPVDYLKIDGSFVKDMVTDPIDRAIVESITQIAHVMHLETIAEWVEDEATLTALHTIGVDFAQGFGIAKPELFL